MGTEGKGIDFREIEKYKEYSDTTNYNFAIIIDGKELDTVCIIAESGHGEVCGSVEFNGDKCYPVEPFGAEIKVDGNITHFKKWIIANWEEISKVIYQLLRENIQRSKDDLAIADRSLSIIKPNQQECVFEHKDYNRIDIDRVFKYDEVNIHTEIHISWCWKHSHWVHREPKEEGVE